MPVFQSKDDAFIFIWCYMLYVKHFNEKDLVNLKQMYNGSYIHKQEVTK